MTYYRYKITLRIVFILLSLSVPKLVFGQPQKGRILSASTNTGVGYVDVGIIGKNIGTVSDASGNFNINLDNIGENDSLRFSMIGYTSRTFLARDFRTDSVRIVYLTPKLYDIEEIKVVYHRPKLTRIGMEVTSGPSSGYGYNFLGSEFGINVNIKHPVRLVDLSLNIATCTFDTVTYRLNIYQKVNQKEYLNILKEPIYLTFTKDRINKPVTFDLTKYSIRAEGNVVIALELYRELGNGKLFFFTYPYSGLIYHRKAIEGSWATTSGAIGMYLRGQLIN